MKKNNLLNLLFSGLILCLVIPQFSYSEQGKKQKIAIISLYDENYKHIGQYSDDNKTKYAQKHGYDLYLYHEILDPSRPGAWSKIIAIQNHLKDYDWVYWSDADSLIMNTEISLDNYIDDRFDIVISKEASNGCLNTGSFLIKNSEWSEKLLNKIYAQTNFIQHEWWEQAALGYILETEPSLLKKVKILPQRSLNSGIWQDWPAGVYQKGDFVIHFYGPCKKADLMREWALRVV